MNKRRCGAFQILDHQATFMIKLILRINAYPKQPPPNTVAYLPETSSFIYHFWDGNRISSGQDLPCRASFSGWPALPTASQGVKKCSVDTTYWNCKQGEQSGSSGHTVHWDQWAGMTLYVGRYWNTNQHCSGPTAGELWSIQHASCHMGKKENISEVCLKSSVISSQLSWTIC